MQGGGTRRDAREPEKQAPAPHADGFRILEPRVVDDLLLMKLTISLLFATTAAATISCWRKETFPGILTLKKRHVEF